MNQQRTSVVAAFHAAHAELGVNLRLLDEAAQGREERVAMLARLLAIRTQLAEHFRDEEQGGFLADLRDKQPNFEHAIRRLLMSADRMRPAKQRAAGAPWLSVCATGSFGAPTLIIDEHRDLAQSLDEIIGIAQSSKTLEDSFGARVRDWIARLSRHEADEADLLVAAYNADLGAAD